MHFWSQGRKKLVFPRHASFLGCLGVYLNCFGHRERMNSL